jgi:hypothetical protein
MVEGYTEPISLIGVKEGKTREMYSNRQAKTKEQHAVSWSLGFSTVCNIATLENCMQFKVKTFFSP